MGKQLRRRPEHQGNQIVPRIKTSGREENFILPDIKGPQVPTVGLKLKIVVFYLGERSGRLRNDRVRLHHHFRLGFPEGTEEPTSEIAPDFACHTMPPNLWVYWREVVKKISRPPPYEAVGCKSLLNTLTSLLITATIKVKGWVSPNDRSF
jgi:hypothetical protein